MEPISEAEGFEFLREAMVAHLGVLLDGRRLLFRTKPGKRFEAIQENPRVCVEVSRFDDQTGDWVSVVVKGTAVERTDEETTTHAVEMLLEKYATVLGSPLGTGGLQPMASFPHVLEVKIDEMTGMTSGRGFTYRTRPGRL